ncbi:OmpA family protein [Streptomyces prunicolor]|uniref:OmpA family protein n=1 Tax=Streptomyces prunicolor TaxID=67348 RepID=A0ABU4F9E1_9ACTN|nr:OmpA family protein [Streptomyces prunicolor]MDV7215900.1 OmpA family protein [Streptomyces prunicolor]
MCPNRSRFAIALLTPTILAVALSTGSSSVQQAGDIPYLGSSGLALRGGATLAPLKILDLGSDPLAISRVVEDQDGTERRKDTDTEVAYSLQSEVLFAKDSSRLSSSAQSRIATIASGIKQQAVTRIRVFGFTDDLGSSAHGDVLSQHRANAVQAVLSDALPSTVAFETRGFGERHPVASNTTEAGRRENRRVEISFPRTAR